MFSGLPHTQGIFKLKKKTQGNSGKFFRLKEWQPCVLSTLYKKKKQILSKIKDQTLDLLYL